MPHAEEKPLLDVRDLSVEFRTADGRTAAVSNANMRIYPRQTLAVVGESGCGKSVTALSTLQLIPNPPGRITGGEIFFGGTDLLGYDAKQMRSVRGNDIAMIFQEPMTSLNPVYTVGWQVLEAIQLHRAAGRAEAIDIATTALREVGIAEPRRRLDEYPHQMSGGMRQRVMIAMALACQPKLLLADEPTTALDVTIQAQILELLRHLQSEHDMSIMLITHDLGVVAENSDAVAVMYAGRVVEYGDVHNIYNNPMHPYTRGLLESVPKLGQTHDRLPTVMNQTPDASVLPGGFTFTPPADAPRDEVSAFPILATMDKEADTPMGRFLTDTALRSPNLYEVAERHWVACWAEDEAAAKLRLTRPDVPYRRGVAVAEAG